MSLQMLVANNIHGFSNQEVEGCDKACFGLI